MVGLHNIRNMLVDGQGSVGQRRRAGRWEWFAQTFADIESLTVIDLGGTAEAWRRAPVRPAMVHVVNLESETARDTGDNPDWIRVHTGDACNLPKHIADGKYDLVFSNSVLEHVGGQLQRQLFADAVHNLADRHWVQTPYRYFPIEPHWLFPGFQFLPLATRAAISRHWPLVHTTPVGREASMRQAMSVELVSRAEMRILFPESTLRAERFLGLAKSLVAIKTL